VWQVKRGQADLKRQPGNALASFSQAIHELEPLRNRMSSRSFVATLGNAFAGKAQAHSQLGQHEAAAQSWNLLVGLEDFHAKTGPPEEVRKRLNLGNWMRAKALTEAGLYPDALEAWDRAAATADKSKQDWFKLYRLDTLARSGAYVQATKDADKLLPEFKSDAGTVAVAGVFAVAVGAAHHDKALSDADRKNKADDYALRCLVLLQEAEKNGWFKQAGNVQKLEQEKTFEAMRTRDEFQAFIQRVTPVKN
jgi:hypothetical protein